MIEVVENPRTGKLRCLAASADPDYSQLMYDAGFNERLLELARYCEKAVGAGNGMKA